jgi:uncharacterized protein
MKRIVFDSYALLALFKKEPGYGLIRDTLVKMANDQCDGFISAITIAEIYYMVLKESNMKNADTAIRAIKEMPIEVIEPDLKLCLDAANIRSRYPLSYADAFAAALTINKKAVLITGLEQFNLLSGESNFKMKYLN